MAPDSRQIELSERAQQLLRLLIKEYVRVGKPVGSRRLAKLFPEGLCAATIRNALADLEEAGFLKQPHTSAGRVPTLQGYRYYVQSLLGNRRLNQKEIDDIRRRLEGENDPEGLMEKASQLLSTYTNTLGIVLSPPASSVVMKHVEFIRLSAQRVLVIIVSRSGQVQHRLLNLDEDISQTELNQAGRYLVDNFANRSLSQIRSELLRLASEERNLYNRLVRNVLTLSSASFENADNSPGSADAPQIFLGGASRLIQRLDRADINRLLFLFDTSEQRGRVVKIISACLREDEGPCITVGLDDHIPGMRDWSLITSSYSYDQDVKGSIGILGPSRMEYERAISLVDYVARLFGQILCCN